MSYHSVRLGLSRPQMLRIFSGDRVQVAPRQIGTGMAFHLTRAQHSALAARVTRGKGFRIQLSRAQIHHHMLHGHGFFSTLKRVGRVLLPLARAVGPILRPLADRELSRLTGKIDNHTARDLATRLGSLGLDRAIGRGLAGGSFRTIGR